MRVHYLQHVPYERPGVIEDWTKENGHVLTRTQLYRSPVFPDLADVDFLVVLGGPMGAEDESEYPWLNPEKAYLEEALGNDVPVLGICLGAQIIASVLGSDIYTARYDEIGWFPIQRAEEGKDHPYLRSWPEEFDVFHWHSDTFDLPEGATHLTENSGCENQAFVYNDQALGLQFHVEMRPRDVEYMLEFAGEHDVQGPRVQDDELILEQRKKCERGNVLLKDTLDKFLG
jgi:GMP synthase-like glutamine amidotransferase